MTETGTATASHATEVKTIRVADYIARTVAGSGAEVFFMVSGGMMMHLMDAFGRTAMRYYCNHHEQACAMAADAYARETGKLGVCLATSGPGATNLLTGLVEPTRIPCLCFSSPASASARRPCGGGG